MTTAFVKKELIDMWREDRIRWLSIIMALLLLTSLIITFRYSQQVKADHEIAMAADREVWDRQRPKNPHSAAHFGFYLFKPVHPLSMFDPGVDRTTGTALYLEAHQRNNDMFNSLADESDLARFGFLSPAFVLQLLVPLLIIVAGFNAVSGERQNGNLHVLFSQGSNAGSLVWGKWRALLSLVGILLVPVLIFSFLALVLLNSNSYNYLATLCLFGLYLIYYAVVISLVIWISSISRSDAHSFLYAILFWTVSCIFLPRIIANVSQQVSPLMNNEEVITRIRKLNEGKDNVHDKTSNAFKHMVDSLLKHYKVDSISQLPVNISGVRLDVGEQTDTRNYEVVTAEQMERLNGQQFIITLGALFSPMIPAQQLSMALANTDIYSHRHFSDAGELYRRKFVNIMNQYIAYESGLQEATTSFKASADLWKRVTVFSYQPPGFITLTNYASAALALLIWLVLSLTLVVIAIKKFKINLP